MLQIPTSPFTRLASPSLQCHCCHFSVVSQSSPFSSSPLPSLGFLCNVPIPQSHSFRRLSVMLQPLSPHIQLYIRESSLLYQLFLSPLLSTLPHLHFLLQLPPRVCFSLSSSFPHPSVRPPSSQFRAPCSRFAPTQ